MLPLNPTLESLYRSHVRELQGFTRRRVGTDEAEDIVQDTYLHALQSGGVASTRHARAYLYRIAANLTVDATRKARVRSRYAEARTSIEEPGEQSHDGEAEAEAVVQLHQLCALLDELPSPCRNACLLHWINDLSHSETALRLGVTVRTVERHLLKAREHLQRRAGWIRHQGDGCPVQHKGGRGSRRGAAAAAHNR